MKPKLLIVELWGLGDLVIGTPFFNAASERYEVTLLAKPYAQDLQTRLWPGVRVVPFVAPWTAFKGKYRLHAWPWPQIRRLLLSLHSERYDVGLSARWDPRDHMLLALTMARTRLGYPRVRSQMFLTHPLARPAPTQHRYEYWRTLASALGFVLPEREAIVMPKARPTQTVLIHSGAGQPVRIWPLPRYHDLAERLRNEGYTVLVACDSDQRQWWLDAGEKNVTTPEAVKELIGLIDISNAFIGNDSGPGHLAAFCGVPTFTLFGSQLPEWFAPLHPAATWIEGKACPYKPCSDYCRFPTPHCLLRVTQDEVWGGVKSFLVREFGGSDRQLPSNDPRSKTNAEAQHLPGP